MLSLSLSLFFSVSPMSFAVYRHVYPCQSVAGARSAVLGSVDRVTGAVSRHTDPTYWWPDDGWPAADLGSGYVSSSSCLSTSSGGIRHSGHAVCLSCGSRQSFSAFYGLIRRKYLMMRGAGTTNWHSYIHTVDDLEHPGVIMYAKGYWQS